MSKQNETSTTADKMTGRLPVRMTNDLLFKHLLQDNQFVLKGLIRDILHLDESEPREDRSPTLS